MNSTVRICHAQNDIVSTPGQLSFGSRPDTVHLGAAILVLWGQDRRGGSDRACRSRQPLAGDFHRGYESTDREGQPAAAIHWLARCRRCRIQGCCRQDDEARSKPAHHSSRGLGAPLVSGCAMRTRATVHFTSSLSRREVKTAHYMLTPNANTQIKRVTLTLVLFVIGRRIKAAGRMTVVHGLQEPPVERHYQLLAGQEGQHPWIRTPRPIELASGGMEYKVGRRRFSGAVSRRRV
jgi:hypothetical protein